MNRQGEEFLFVLRGSLHVDADGATLPLSEGDALFLGSGTPYRWRNGSEGETLLLLVSSP
jgi:mannose-6-phosphate isomerase-like protein (cupin superfamily)